MLCINVDQLLLVACTAGLSRARPWPLPIHEAGQLLGKAGPKHASFSTAMNQSTLASKAYQIYSRIVITVDRKM